MGFIDYHGTKEDRYTEVLEYSRAQQEEDWNRKEEQKVALWLKDLTGSSSYAQLNVEDLLKYVVIKYRSMQILWPELMKYIKSGSGIDENRIWKDFSLDMAARHLSVFHLTPDRRNKYLQTFQIKIFKIEDPLPAEEHYQRVADTPKYRQYFAECFDPTWKGQHFFKWIKAGIKKNPAGLKTADDFLNEDIQLCLFLGLYLHQIILPQDDGWMREIESERKALSDIRNKMYRSSLPAPDKSMLVNPLDSAEIAEKSCGADEPDTDESEVSKILDSGLDKKRFNELIQKGDIPSYVVAAGLVLECNLPEEIAQIYRQLIDRMPVLQDAVIKYDDIYNADMDQFEEYFAPEALRITAVYLDYQAARPSEKILKETRDGVFLAARKLLQVVNEKIDEIYRFVTIDANAQAKAIETLMSQDGYIDPEHRIK